MPSPPVDRRREQALPGIGESRSDLRSGHAVGYDVGMPGLVTRSGRSTRMPYPPIGDYGFISDCHSVALVSAGGSIDWCCMRRVDAGSCFGRLLDWRIGGYFSIAPAGEDGHESHREYLESSLVLATTFVTSGGEARLIDAFSMRRGGRHEPLQELLRVIEGVSGSVEMEIEIVPRFDYGGMKPWLRRAGARTWTVIGGDDGLLVSSEAELEQIDHHDLRCRVSVRAGERVRLVMRSSRPHLIDEGNLDAPSSVKVDEHLEATLAWWRRWAAQATIEGPDRPALLRSAVVLKGLSNAPTGAIAAAATTSLPERIGGERNWDYRYSWIRDSYLAVRSLALVGFDREADGFRRFIQRSSAGSAHELQIMYGVGGERRLTELTLDHLEGYRGSRPVRLGNGAADQLQLDAYGSLLLLSWHWHRRGQSPDDDYWRFLVDLVDVACQRWDEPDRSIWEIRGEPRHFVFSKVMCWAAADRGIALAGECMRNAPLQRWRKALARMRDSIESNGVDPDRGNFVQAYGSRELDSASLLIPTTYYCAFDDQRMVRTTDAVRDELVVDGLLLRYRTESGVDGLSLDREGSFIACTFWLARCLAAQGRTGEARAVFDRAAASANDLGLYAEEFDARSHELLGNFPQAFTHLAHIASAVALSSGRLE